MKNSSFTLLLDSFDYVGIKLKTVQVYYQLSLYKHRWLDKKKTNKIKFEVKNMERIK
jgi:hypothetical protein